MNFAWSARREPDGMAVSPESDAAKESRSGSHVESARGVYPLYFAANAAPRVAMLVVLIVLTRLLPTTEYGLFALVVTTGEILEMASSNWIRVYLLRTEAGANELRPRRLGRSLALSAGCALAGLVISVAVAPFIAGERAAAMMLATAAYIAAFALLRLTLTLAQLSRSHRTYAAVECGRALGIVTATIIVAVAEPHSFLPTSIALSLVTGAAAAFGLASVSRSLTRPLLPRGGYWAALAFGVPYLLASTLFFTIGWFDRFIVNYFLGAAAVGIYVAAYSVARQPVELFTSGLNAFSFPLLVRTYANGGVQSAGPVQSGVMLTMTVLGFGIVAGLSLTADPLATLLFPHDYRADAASLIPWIAAATFLLSMKQFVFDNSLHAAQQNMPLLVAMIPPVAISIGLGIVLVRGHGLFGAAINYLVVSSVAVLSAAVISRRVFAFAIPWRGLAKVALAALVASAASWGVIHDLAWGAVTVVIVAAAVFCAVYGALLTMLGFSLRRLIETPWAPLSEGTLTPREFPRTAPGSAR